MIRLDCVLIAAASVFLATVVSAAPITEKQGGALKYPVRNAAVMHHLRELLAGRWQKVIKMGVTGEVHYFEHASGQVAGVKFFPNEEGS